MASFENVSRTHEPIQPFSEETRREYEQLLESQHPRCRFDASKRAKYRAILLNSDVFKTNTKDPEYKKIENQRNFCRKHFKLGKAVAGEREDQLYRLPLGDMDNPIKSRVQNPQYVICTYEAFDIVSALHLEMGHVEKNRMWEEFDRRFYGVTRDEINWLIKRCEICLRNRPSNTKPPLTPIRSYRILERIQIDLIDKRSQPDGKFNWILTVRDHCSKFIWLYALERKQAYDVADRMAMWMAAAGEPCSILQCDNGTEFKGVCEELFRKFGVQIKHGRPRTPHVQGLVEQANATVKERLRAWIMTTGRSDWHNALPLIAMQMNRAPHGTLGRSISPHHVFFGRQPRFGLENTLSQMNGNVSDGVSDAQIDREWDSPDLEGLLGEGDHEASQLTADNNDAMENDSQNSVADTGVTNVLRTPITDTQIDPDLLRIQTEMEINEPVPHTSPVNRQNQHAQGGFTVRDSQIHSNEYRQHLRSHSQTGNNCNPTSFTAMEKAIQPQADKAIKRSIQKHSKRHKITTFKVGSFVMLAIPREDRSKGDPHRIPCRVLKGPIGSDQYLLQTQWGVLERLQPTRVLNLAPSSTSFYRSFPAPPTNPDKLKQSQKISLRTASHLSSAAQSGTDKTRIYCNCGLKSKRPACTTVSKRCPCRNNKAMCTNYCHGLDSSCECHNLAPQKHRNTATVVQNDSSSGPMEVDSPGSEIDSDAIAFQLEQELRH